jgi:hypothetical protein
MAITRQNLRRGLSDLLGDLIRDPDGSISTPSVNGAGDGTTLVDALLAYYEDDYFNDGYCVLPLGIDGGSSYAVLRVSDFTSSTGTLTFSPAATGQITTSAPFELHRYDPSLKHIAINRGALQASRTLYLPLRDTSLVLDGLGSNMDMETFAASAFTSWDDIGSVTEATETSIVYLGAQSMKLTGGGAASGKGQTLVVNRSQVVGRTLTFEVWCWSTTASGAYIAIFFGSGNSANTSEGDQESQHDGDEDWQLLKIEVAIPSDATEITIRCHVDNTVVAFFDASSCWINARPVQRYTVPSSMTQGPYEVLVQSDEDFIDGRYLPIGRGYRGSAGSRIKLIGRGILTAVTSETGTMEISDPDVELLYAYALRFMSMALRGSAGSYEAERLTADLAMWAQLANMLEDTPGMHVEPLTTDYPDGGEYWKIENSGETKLLILAR